jgi:predicted GNAT superfamily acetyltransferase
MTSQVRDLIPSDLGAVLEINQANTPEVGSVDPARLEFIFTESDIALAATVADALVGFVLVLGQGSSYDSVNYRWFMDRHGDAMYLDRVAIDASNRGVGIGRSLYEAVFQRMREAHLNTPLLGLEVNVDPPNPSSVAFHRALGFEEVGRQKTPYGAEVSMMSRRILS